MIREDQSGFRNVFQIGIGYLSVTVRHLFFTQNEMVRAIVLSQFLKDQRRIGSIIPDDQAAVLSGGSGPDGVIFIAFFNSVAFSSIGRFISRIQFKGNALQRIAQLVHLGDLTFGNGDQIKFQAHVGVCVAPLQIEKF